MSFHFRAFSFVDRITALKAGERIQGLYTIPDTIKAFPSSLVGEATGQLAAWASMSALDYQVRPLAGLAGGVDVLAPVHPGQVLELSATLTSLDSDAVEYCGEACVNGTPVLRLHQCVGPMLPMADFDDPQAVRERFELLCASGAASGAFGGLPDLAFQVSGGESGQSLLASFEVPAAASFFEDHFPRRPVFPGSLLMNLNLELAGRLVAELPLPAGSRWKLLSLNNVKLRTFIPPGEQLEMEVRIEEQTGDSVRMVVDNRKGKRLVGGVRVNFTKENCS